MVSCEREIDARELPGVGEIVWKLLGNRHLVALHTPGRTGHAVYSGTDGEQAHQAYLHPFAQPAVPNVFELV